jgi:hypothetical protein
MAIVRIRAILGGLLLATVMAAVLLPAAIARAEDAEKARELYRQGSKYYDVGQFDKAIDFWQQAYDQKPDPSFLYNIAQAYRQKEDPKQAIFFYKSYLRNAPKAANKAEVQQRIDTLQKQLDSGGKGTGTTPPPPTTAPPPAVPPPLPTTTPPGIVVTPPTPITPPPPSPTTTQPAAFADPPPEVVGGPEAVAAANLPDRNRPLDLAAAIGFDSWSSGFAGSADPAFAFTLSGGYTFGSPASNVRFRLGGLFGYTFLSEMSWRETFLSLVIDPTLEIRLAPRWFLTGDLGLGMLTILGLRPQSVLLQQTQMLMINGAQSLFLARLGAGIHFRVTNELCVFLSPALANSAKKAHYYDDIRRVEMLFGLAFRP